jgi:parvulin-like peptidyl-prolyl isomerase
VALEKVVAILRAFESGADFGELARQHSEDGTAVQGGDLGLFTLDELSAEFRGAVVSMAQGQISPVLETPKGYQLLMLEEIKETPAKTLKEVSIEIHERLFQEFVEERYSAWLKGLRDRSYVKVIL